MAFIPPLPATSTNRHVHLTCPDVFLAKPSWPSRTIKETIKKIHVVTDIVKELLSHAAL